MGKLIAKRLVLLVPVLLAASMLTFLMVSLLPGCVECEILGPDNITPEAIAAVRADLGLDQPLPLRYLHWLGNALTGDLGQSYRTDQGVTEALLERLPVTLEIVVVSMLLSLAIAIPLGVLSAHRAGSRLDRGITGTTFGLLSIPSFMMALLLIYIFAVELRWFPATGWTSFQDDPVKNLRSVFMPALALSTASVAVFTRLLRTDMITTLQEDHVLLARSKGLTTRKILFRYALRPSSLSLITIAGITLGNLLGGALIVEQLFALPGMGRLMVDSIFQRDLLIVQGGVLLITTGFVLANFAVDILYAVLDPRIRQGNARAQR